MAARGRRHKDCGGGEDCGGGGEDCCGGEAASGEGARCEGRNGGAGSGCGGCGEAVRRERLWLCGVGRDSVRGDLAGAVAQLNQWSDVGAGGFGGERRVALCGGSEGGGGGGQPECAGDVGGRRQDVARGDCAQPGATAFGAGGGRRRGAMGGGPGWCLLFGKPGRELADGEGNVPARRQQHLL